MGRSASIHSLANDDEKFQKWLATKRNELDAQAQQLRDEQNKAIMSFNDNNGYTDSQTLLTGHNVDFQQEDEWSLANLKVVVDTIGKTIFNIDNQQVAGADVDQTNADAAAKAVLAKDKSFGQGAEAQANLAYYVGGKVFEILSGVLLSFGHSTKLDYSHSFKSKPLGYGYQLFCTVAGASYTSKTFFRNKSIFQYLFIYELRWSAQQAAKEESISAFKRYEDQIATFNKKISHLLQEVTDGSITGKQYLELSKIWQSLIKGAEDKMKKLVPDNSSSPLVLGLISLKGDENHPASSDSMLEVKIKAIREALLQKHAIVAYKEVDSVDTKAYHMILDSIKEKKNVETIAHELNMEFPTGQRGGNWTGGPRN